MTINNTTQWNERGFPSHRATAPADGHDSGGDDALQSGRLSALAGVGMIVAGFLAFGPPVLRIDVDASEVYVENTLWGSAYWTVPMAEFVGAWFLPELSSSRAPRADADGVNRWVVILDRALVKSPFVSAYPGSPNPGAPPYPAPPPYP